MKKIVLIFVTLLISVSVFAFDLGAIIASGTSCKVDGLEYTIPMFEQQETFTGNLSIPFGRTMYLAMEGSVQHKYESDFGTGPDYNRNNVILDLTLLKFNKTLRINNSSNLQISAGRMFTNDYTNIIFAQSNDGALVQYSSPIIEASGYFGYSGLQNIKNVSILSSKGNKIVNSDEKDLYDFAAPYLTGSVSVSAPYLFLNQSLGFEFLGVFPSDGPSSLPEGEDSRVYFTLGLNGPLLSSLFYDVSGTLQTSVDVAILVKANLNYYLPVDDACVGLSMVYASGENGSLKPFVGFTKGKACLSAEELPYSGIFKCGFVISGVGSKKVFASFGTDVVFDVRDESKFYGLQNSLAIRAQVLSDLQFSVGMNTFVSDDAAPNRIELMVGMAFAF